jgi:GNAT superfamily N-acetyltransferase
MQRHVEALYVHDPRGRIVRVNEWDGGPPPRFFLGRTEAGHVFRARADLPDALVASLFALCRTEPVTAQPHRLPVNADRYTALLARHAPIEGVRAGPAYAFASTRPTDAAGDGQAISIGATNAQLLEGGLGAWSPDVAYRRPFLAIVEEGRAVALCASVRITPAAHEAGVETVPEYRRRGLATRVVTAWANAVARTGALPLYSTSWENTASRAVAKRLELEMFGVDFQVT